MALRKRRIQLEGNSGGQRWHDASIAFQEVDPETSFGMQASDYCFPRASHQPMDCATAAYLSATPGAGLVTPQATAYTGPMDVTANRPPQISRPPRQPPKIPAI